MTLLVRSTCDYDSKKRRFCDCHEAGPVQVEAQDLGKQAMQGAC